MDSIFKDSIVRKTALVLVVAVLVIGSIVGFFIYNKNQTDLQKKQKYAGQPNDSTKTVFLAKVDTVAKAKSGVTGLLRRFSNYFDAVIWITTEPDSFPQTDPIDPRIKYYTTSNDSTAILLAKKIFVDNNWMQKTHRCIFHSSIFTKRQDEMLTAMSNDGIVTYIALLEYNYKPRSFSKEK